MTHAGQSGPEIGYLGSGLVRPECVVTTWSGDVFVSNFDGGVTQLTKQGAREDILARDAGVSLKTNGFAITPDMSFLIANLGDEGGVWRLRRDGSAAPFLTIFDGAALPPANFVSVDECGGVWISISTRATPRAKAYRPDVADGFILYVDNSGVRLAADQLGYTNEVHRRPGDDWLYVNETFARRLSRFKVYGPGKLGRRETVWEFGPGEFPDGLWFDDDGGVIVTCIISNRVLRISSGGVSTVLVEDADPIHIARVEAAYKAGIMGRNELDSTPAQRLRNVSSIAFGGEDRKDAFLGCLLDDKIVTFRSPYAGVAPPHWKWI